MNYLELIRFRFDATCVNPRPYILDFIAFVDTSSDRRLFDWLCSYYAVPNQSYTTLSTAHYRFLELFGYFCPWDEIESKLGERENVRRCRSPLMAGSIAAGSKSDIEHYRESAKELFVGFSDRQISEYALSHGNLEVSRHFVENSFQTTNMSYWDNVEPYHLNSGNQILFNSSKSNESLIWLFSETPYLTYRKADDITEIVWEVLHYDLRTFRAFFSKALSVFGVADTDFIKECFLEAIELRNLEVFEFLFKEYKDEFEASVRPRWNDFRWILPRYQRLSRQNFKSWQIIIEKGKLLEPLMLMEDERRALLRHTLTNGLSRELEYFIGAGFDVVELLLLKDETFAFLDKVITPHELDFGCMNLIWSAFERDPSSHLSIRKLGLFMVGHIRRCFFYLSPLKQDMDQAVRFFERVMNATGNSNGIPLNTSHFNHFNQLRDLINGELAPWRSPLSRLFTGDPKRALTLE
jgi:hypothetical protein